MKFVFSVILVFLVLEYTVAQRKSKIYNFICYESTIKNYFVFFKQKKKDKWSLK